MLLMEILVYFSPWILPHIPETFGSYHSTISIRVGMPLITEQGLSARVLEGCTLELKIQDPNHTGNDQNTGIVFSLFLFLVFPLFF